MDNGLWVDNDFNLIGCEVKEPASLYDFQGLIHHCCRVNRDFRTHLPRWMGECFRYCHALQLFLGMVAKRPPACRENDSFYFICLASTQSLENSTMFTVDGQNVCPCLLCQPHNQGACHDERLFVGQGDRFAHCNGRQGTL